MGIKLKKTYAFAVISALYITLFSAILLTLIQVILYEFSLALTLSFSIGILIFSIIVIQYRSELFIYQRVKKIYDDVSLLDSATLRSQSITTDMATLEREVKKYATDKKLELENLKVREEYRREFMGNVSHELKTPLFTVQGYIETLIDGVKDKNMRIKYLERAQKGVERLVYIVQDLDMIAKLEMGEVTLEYTEFNIVDLIQNVFDMLEMQADKKNIILMFDRKYSKAIRVHADKEKIQQVLINLVMNSIKYGKENGTTEVTIEDLVKNKVIVRIRDNGEGIEKHHIPRLFERFYRVDKSGARSEGGSGLGLSIVKHIIEGHDEKIYIESDFGNGSEFSFTLEKAKQING
ncbi:MAG: sensor histidine kinase [Flavobacterium sp.]|uniref:sensor histidine kinase n=1 Tax=Flavobacterium sp. TaxID=239 RepID=UPI0022C060A5|nr:ATP-binding protein [Flavobacterium sp.]MCZ8168584.1 ATP-binding protein [Flavobacterium sp.]MCZ8297300.1 ATP-binding protein [Flavobacterium sp.]